MDKVSEWYEKSGTARSGKFCGADASCASEERLTSAVTSDVSYTVQTAIVDANELTVSEDGRKVGQDLGEMFAADEGDDEVDDGKYDDKEDARDLHEPRVDRLEAEGACESRREEGQPSRRSRRLYRGPRGPGTSQDRPETSQGPPDEVWAHRSTY